MSIRSESPISNTKIYDSLLLLKDAGLVASSAAATVSSSAKIINLGLGKVNGEIVIDATAVEIASNDEVYIVVAEFSNSSSFSSGIVGGPMTYLGSAGGIPGGTDTDKGVGRYVLPFSNQIANTHYQYMRLYTIVAGTIATGINYSAFISKMDGNAN